MSDPDDYALPPQILGDELKHLDTFLQTNGCSVTKIQRAMQPRTAHCSINAEEQIEAGKASLPYYINKVTH